MAFKLPQEPIRNRKEFLTYLLATACGVGLALGLERAAEWWKERSLVKEARHNLALEISDTRARLAAWREKDLPELVANCDALSDYTQEMLKQGFSPRHELKVAFKWITLNSAAWRAAEATGAAGHMTYAETKEYAEFYTMQQEFVRIQSGLVDEVAPMVTLFQKGVDPTRNQPREDMIVLGKQARALGFKLSTLGSVGKALEEMAQKTVGAKK